MSFLEIPEHIAYLSDMERIGEGLRRIGKLDGEQIDHVVTLQAEGDRRLFGEIAVGLDYMAVDDLIHYLRDTGQGEHDVV